MSPAAPRAVFFDLGGTLFSYREIPALSRPIFDEAVRRLGVRLAPGRLGPAYARAMREAEARWLHREFYLHRDLFHDTYRTFARELGAAPGDDFYDWLYDAQRAVMVERVPLREGCLETLAALRARGLALSIVSNIDDDYLVPMVENFGLAPYLDHWSSSEEARSCKPHRGIFDLALGKAGLDAGEVVFVGDSRHHDVRGAGALGMTTVLIDEGGSPGPPDPGDAEPDHVIRALDELLAVLPGGD